MINNYLIFIYIPSKIFMFGLQSYLDQLKDPLIFPFVLLLYASKYTLKGLQETKQTLKFFYRKP